MHIFRYSERGAAVTAKWQTGHKNALPWLWGCTAGVAVLLVVRLAVWGSMPAEALGTNVAAIVFAAVVCAVLTAKERKTARCLRRCSFCLTIEDERVQITDPLTKETRFRCTFGDVLQADMGSEILRIATACDGVCLPKEAVPERLIKYLQENDGCAVYTRSWM